MATSLVILIIAFATFIQTFAGFGFSIIAISLLTISLPILTSSVLVTLAIFPLTTWIVFKNIKLINWKALIIPSLFSVFGTQLGIKMLMVIRNEILLLILGVVLVMLALYLLIKPDAVQLKPTMSTQMAVGIFSGVLSGMFTMGGPPIAVYVNSITKEKFAANATLQMFFLIGATVSMITHWRLGNFSAEVLHYLPYGLLAVLMGCLPGLLLFKKVSSESLQKYTYLLMLAMGLLVLVRSV